MKQLTRSDLILNFTSKVDSLLRVLVVALKSPHSWTAWSLFLHLSSHQVHWHYLINLAASETLMFRAVNLNEVNNRTTARSRSQVIYVLTRDQLEVRRAQAKEK